MDGMTNSRLVGTAEKRFSCAGAVGCTRAPCGLDALGAAACIGAVGKLHPCPLLPSVLSVHPVDQLTTVRAADRAVMWSQGS